MGYWKIWTAPVMVLFLYFGCFNYLDVKDAGISWNPLTGTIALQERGPNITPPWVFVTVLDTRPQRVCVTTASRAFNCKLVQFVSSEYEALIAAEGWHYYWWYNRFSLNWGYAEEYRGLRDMLRGYAYSIRPFPFLKILVEYEDSEQ